MRWGPSSTRSAAEIWCRGVDTKPSPGPVCSAGLTPQADPSTCQLLHPVQLFTVAPQRGALKVSPTQIWTPLTATITILFRDPDWKEKNKKSLINDLIQSPDLPAVQQGSITLPWQLSPESGCSFWAGLSSPAVDCFSGICLEKAKQVYWPPSSLPVFVSGSVWRIRLSDPRLSPSPPLWTERMLGLQACFPRPAMLLPSCHQGQNQERWNGRRKLIPHDASGKDNTHQGLWKTGSPLASQPSANLWGFNEIQLKRPGQWLLIQNELSRWTVVHWRVTWPCSTPPRLSSVSICNTSNKTNPSVATIMQDKLLKKPL